MKQVTLMHKDVPTVTFSMNESGFCTRIQSVENEDHLPPALRYLDDPGDVSFWLSKRRLSKKRPDVTALKESGITDAKNFYPLHYLSLYDCYWIRLSGDETFDDVTLYQQPVVDDVFSLMEDKDQPFDIIPSRDTGNLTLPLPRECRCLQDEEDATVFYFLIRCEITEQPRYLLEKYRDYVPTVDGDYYILYDQVFFRFENSTSPAMEYIPAADLYNGYARNPLYKGMEPENVFFTAVKEAGIKDGNKFLAAMIALDDRYKIRRSLESFGYFRDPDTLEPLGFAPLFLFPKGTEK